MNPASFCLQQKTITILLTVLAVFFGFYAYAHLGRLSYPDFTAKTAMITTRFPGASPAEVEELVTNVLEEALQSMNEVEKITSRSEAGVSYIRVEVFSSVRSRELPQIWDFLRKKMKDVQPQLPAGCAEPVINDDFGDVYGIYFALTCTESFARGKTQADQLRWLKEQGRWLKKELLNLNRVHDVARIDFYGIQPEVIYLEIPQAKLATQGILPFRIMQELENQNQLVDAGNVRVGNDSVRISPTGAFVSLENILGIMVSDSTGESVISLGDLVEKDHLVRETLEPPTTLFRFNGRPAIAMGISTKKGGNVVFMGDDISRLLQTLRRDQWPEGLEIHTISDQARNVTEAVDAFLMNLCESLGIVVVLLMIFMGWRSGLLIGAVLLLTILLTFLVMYLCGIALQIISLGALVIALGMLVDNAIVVLEESLLSVQRGVSRETSVLLAVKKNQFPLLGGTSIAILAFAAIGFVPDSIGEFCVSLFQVLAISLTMSWVTAVTVLPLLSVWFLPVPKTAPEKAQKISPKPVYGSFFYHVYRSGLSFALDHRWCVVGGTVLLLVLAFWAFGKIPGSFFGNSARNQFLINYWRVEGTAIELTDADTRKIEAFLLTLPGVKSTSAFVGSGSLRFILTYEYRVPASCFSQILVTVEDWRQIPEIAAQAREFMRQNFPNAAPQVRFFREGPDVAYSIELEFRGANADELRRLANQTKAIFAQFPETIELRDDWRQKVMVLRPELREDFVKKAGLSRAEIARAIHTSLKGMTIGWFRAGEENIPICWRLPAEERADVSRLGGIQIYCANLRTFLRLDQLAYHLTRLEYEDPILRRVNRKPAIKVQCNARGVPASVLRKRLEEAIQTADLKLPPGCEMTWRGEFEELNKGTKPIIRTFPLCLLGMFLICVGMFNRLLQPVLIFLTAPLCIIGGALGLWFTGHSFEFLCIPGFLGLSGILIRNAIILVGETDRTRGQNAGKCTQERDPEKSPVNPEKTDRDVLIGTAVSRFRPVMLASGTTILGILPLLDDAFYGALSAVLVGGLLVATLLTLVVLPVFYSLAHGIHEKR